MKLINRIVFFLLIPVFAQAQSPTAAELSVWANEAIVATYTFDYKNFLQEQQEIAKYFTAAGWSAYSKALNDSKLPESIQKNNYFVSAVATYPPQVTPVGTNQWEADMPLLVIYKNPQYQQKQSLEVTIRFATVPSGQGIRGLAINSLKSKITEPPCTCKPVSSEPKDDTQ